MESVFYYPVTLHTGVVTSPVVAPWVNTLPNSGNIQSLVLVLVGSDGSQLPGLYLWDGSRWRLTIPYQNVAFSVISGAAIDVYFTLTSPVTLPTTGTIEVWRNSLQFETATLNADATVVWGTSYLPAGAVGSVSSVNNVGPDGTGNITIGIAQIPGLTAALAAAGTVKSVNGVGPDGNGNVTVTFPVNSVNTKTGAVVISAAPNAAGTGLSPVFDSGATTGTILLRKFVAGLGIVTTIDGNGNLNFSSTGVQTVNGNGPDGAGNVVVPPYTLPVATASVLGGVKQGTGLTIAGDGTISLTTPYVLPVATTSTLGGVIVKSGLLVDGSGNLSLDASAVATSVNAKVGAVTITAGTNITIDNSGSSIVISSTGGGGGGTVQQVALSMPSIFNVSGSPVTTTGTLTATLASQTANTIFRGPTSGSANIPTFGALVAADLPLATTALVGGVSVGTGLSVNGAGVLSINYTTLVQTFNGRTGAVTLSTNDLTALGAALVGIANTYTGVNDFTGGTAKVATQTTSDSTTNAASTAFVHAAISAIGTGVVSFNTRSGAVTLTGADITGAGGALLASPTFTGTPAAPTPLTTDNSTTLATTAFVKNVVGSYAPLASPALTGTPTAPTASAGTNTTQLATTAFVQAAVGAAGVTSFNTRTGAVVLTGADITSAGGALLASPTFTGVPAVPTAVTTDNSTTIASTAFVHAAIAAIPVQVTSFNTRTGAVTLTAGDVTGVGGALLASPAFTGTPTAPTAASSDNSTTLATTAFVQAVVVAATVAPATTSSTGVVQVGAGLSITVPGVLSANVTTVAGRTGAVTLAVADVTGAAPLASPTFTGTPVVPTAALNNNTTQIASTAFVQSAITNGAVASFNGRTGVVTFTAADVTNVGGALLASPALTGTPTAPTAAAGTVTTQLASTAFVQTMAFGSEISVALTNANISLGTNANYPTIIFTGTLTGNIVVTLPNVGHWNFYNKTTGGFTVTLGNGSGATYVLQQSGSAHLFSDSSLGVTPTQTTGITQTATDSSTLLATTAYVHNLLGTGTNIVTSFNTRTGAVTLTGADVSGVGGALVASSNTFSAANTFSALNDFSSGSIKVPLAAVGDSSTTAASTSYVAQWLATTTPVALTAVNISLTPAQYRTSIIEFTGALTASVVVTVPTSGEWTFYNNTTGAFNVSLSNGSGATYVVPQNQSAQAVSLGSLGVINGNVAGFTLTPATATTLGGVIIPNSGGLTVDSLGNLTVAAASGGSVGGVKQGSGVTIAGDGTISSNILTVAGVAPTTGNVVLAVGNITGAAPLASPALTGTPTAPTPTPGASTTQIATAAYVLSSLTPSLITVTGSITLSSAQYGNFDLMFQTNGSYNITFPTTGEWNVMSTSWSSGSLTLTNGTGTNVTLPAGGSLHVVSSASGMALFSSSSAGVTSFNTRTGAVTLTGADVTGVGGALLASPAFTGIPTAPTATIGTNNTQLATTAYTYNATQGGTSVALAAANVTLSAAQYSVPVIVFTGTLTANVTVTVPTTGEWTFLNLTTGAFTVTVTNAVASSATLVIPQSTTSATIAVSNNSTTGVVIASSSGVTTFNTRSGAVTLTAADVTGVGGALLASPVFTGRPTIPASLFTSTALGSVSGTQTLNWAIASEWSFTVSAATTLAFTNPPASGFGEVVYLRITNGGAFTLTWPTGTQFAGGSAPTLTASGVDIIGVRYDTIAAQYQVFPIGLNVR